MEQSSRTLFDYFRQYATERKDDLFLFTETTSYTVGQTLSVVASLATQLYGVGIRKGDFVAVKTKRSVFSVLQFYALQFLGAVAVLFDPHESCLEYDYVLDDGILTAGGQSVKLDFSVPLRETHQVPYLLESKQTSIVIFTSGSTGESKAVQLSQFNFINNSLDTQPLGGYRKDDVNILIVPIHHVFGLALIITAVVTQHAIFIPATVECEYVLDCMEKYGITRLNGVPSMYLALAEKKGARNITTLNCGLIAGAPCSKEQFIKIENALGITLVPVYGMSECIGISCGNYADCVDDRCDNVGRIYSMNTIKIDFDGEILVKSPAMSCGYYTKTGTCNTTDADGWLHTGDLGFLDQNGFLHISGRKKDIIIRNGNNISSVAIEQKLLTIPQIKDVCVVGIADQTEGEVPCALLVSERSELDYKKLCLSVLNKLELPKYFIVGNKIPLTASGKADKQKVIKMFETSEGWER